MIQDTGLQTEIVRILMNAKEKVIIKSFATVILIIIPNVTIFKKFLAYPTGVSSLIGTHLSGLIWPQLPGLIVPPVYTINKIV